MVIPVARLRTTCALAGASLIWNAPFLSLLEILVYPNDQNMLKKPARMPKRVRYSPGPAEVWDVVVKATEKTRITAETTLSTSWDQNPKYPSFLNCLDACAIFFCAASRVFFPDVGSPPVPSFFADATARAFLPSRFPTLLFLHLPTTFLRFLHPEIPHVFATAVATKAIATPGSTDRGLSSPRLSPPPGPSKDRKDRRSTVGGMGGTPLLPPPMQQQQQQQQVGGGLPVRSHPPRDPPHTPGWRGHCLREKEGASRGRASREEEGERALREGGREGIE
eukprot:scaffold776_cov347-Pavlova_lutheri.AAC.98